MCSSDLFQYIPSPKTVFRHVRKLPAGHYLLVTPNGLTEREYWDIDFSQPEQREDAYWSSELLNALYDSVDLRLISDVPLGAFLSSGVDSSAVVAMKRIDRRGRMVSEAQALAIERMLEMPVALSMAPL